MTRTWGLVATAAGLVVTVFVAAPASATDAPDSRCAGMTRLHVRTER